MFEEIVKFIRGLYKTDGYIPLHEPRFIGEEKKYLIDCIDSTFVSSVGKYVDEFEHSIKEITKLDYAIATTNGTSALHTCLNLIGANASCEVITQAVSFVATANAIAYTGAKIIFLDSDQDNLGMSPSSLKDFIETECIFDGEKLVNKKTHRHVKACVVMHVFGHPVKIDELSDLCDKYNLTLIEDAAESLGSYYMGRHTGHWGLLSTLSFNGNKIITCGGGGMVVTKSEFLAKKAKNLTTTSKRSHPWEFFHDELAYNYRLPNLNAALGVAQMKKLDFFIRNKRETANFYEEFFNNTNVQFLKESKDAKSNYWLNAIRFESEKEKNNFLNYSNEKGVMVRPLWTLLSDLPMYVDAQRDSLKNAKWHYSTIVNIPSSVRL